MARLIVQPAPIFTSPKITDSLIKEPAAMLLRKPRTDL
ncbi:Uncharacterised protein [Vibrio cholerae]|nr:Uncharacterised protein [Vibrio cholerae]CSC99536.1 Uncharacterised protein [Vibrio cholerae]